MKANSASHNQLHCPHCGHFAGASVNCSNCGARLETRIELKWLKSGALVLAVCGLFLLQLYSSCRELPLVTVGEISPHMNFASVRVSGMLDSDARELRNNTTLYIINDGTGTLPVFLNNTANPKLPKKGSYVEASGSLSVAAGNEVRMRARSVEQVAGVPVEAVDTILSDVQLGDVSIRQAGACMRACGRVVSFVEPRPGSKAPYKILLADHSGTLEVVHWFEPGRIWEAGDTLEAIGRVDLYRGKVQLKVQRADGLTHLE